MACVRRGSNGDKENDVSVLTPDSRGRRFLTSAELSRVAGSHRRLSPLVSSLSHGGSCSLAGGRDLFVLEGARGERSPWQRGLRAFRGVGRGDVRGLKWVFKCKSSSSAPTDAG